MRTLVIVLGLLGLVAVAHADDRKRAAEHFALAEKAEARKDWRAAITQYQAAYDASPHPSVLYNIGQNHARLGEGRTAAGFYQRYLDESTDPPDRRKVEGLIRKLASAPTELQVIGQPPGATVIIDDQPAGAAPLTIEVTAGEHTVALAAGGRTSPVQSITAEYGEPLTVRIDLERRPGTLLVYANVDGAEVQVDGNRVGRTPFSGGIPAGTYQVLVSKPGYRTVQREVEITPGGSKQVRANLDRMDGTPDPENPPEGAKILIGWSFGWDLTTEGGRYLFELGYRTPGNHLEGSLLLGSFGGNTGGGLGASGKIYFLTRTVRPYAKVGVMLAQTSSTTDERVTLFEGGGGVLISGKRGKTAGRVRRYSLDYYLELAANLQLQEPAADESRLGVLLIAGILLRYGG